MFNNLISGFQFSCPDELVLEVARRTREDMLVQPQD